MAYAFKKVCKISRIDIFKTVYVISRAMTVSCKNARTLTVSSYGKERKTKGRDNVVYLKLFNKSLKMTMFMSAFFPGRHYITLFVVRSLHVIHELRK